MFSGSKLRIRTMGTRTRKWNSEVHKGSLSKMIPHGREQELPVGYLRLDSMGKAKVQ